VCQLRVVAISIPDGVNLYDGREMKGCHQNDWCSGFHALQGVEFFVQRRKPKVGLLGNERTAQRAQPK
jgi:hypothetical protein